MLFAIKDSKAKSRITVCNEDFVYSIDSNNLVSIVRCISSKPDLFIPRKIDGKWVRYIEEKAFFNISTLRTLGCPAHICSIGQSAFANCINLKKLVLPHDVHQLEANWVYGCDNLNKIVFPGINANVSSDFFALNITCKVVFGHKTESINIPRTNSALFTQVAVDKRNKHFASDGICLFSPDFKTLIRCLVHTETYTIPKGCIYIAEKAFAYNTVLKGINMTEGIQSIGNHAFTGTGIVALQCPSSLREIGNYAFSNCCELKTVILNKGLREIGEHSFFRCQQLTDVKVPSTLSKIGNYSFSRCDSLRPDSKHGLVIASDNPYYLVDEQGVLYKKRHDGEFELVIALCPLKGNYKVLQNTKRIRKGAFESNKELESVVFPPSLRIIGAQAFLKCTKLVEAELPEGLAEIGSEAFRFTGLRKIRIPSTLCKLGDSVFSAKKMNMPSGSNMSRTSLIIANAIGILRSSYSPKSNQVQNIDNCSHTIIDVDARNGSFWVESDFLCKRGEDCGIKAIQYFGNSDKVVVPDSVTIIESNAFIAQDNVKELVIPSTLKYIGTSGLQTQHSLELIRITNSSSGEIILYPAPNVAGIWAQNHAFSQNELDMELLIQDCDESLIRMLPSVERTSKVIERMANGMLIEPRILDQFNQIILASLDEIIRHFASHSRLNIFTQLIELGFINEENIVHAVELTSEVKGISATNILLNAQSRMCQFCISEFEL